MTAAQWLLAPLGSVDRMVADLGGRHLASLDPTSLMKAAQRLERWDDFGDPAFLEPLQRLVTSLEDDADLHLPGRLHLRSQLVRALRTRLRLTRTLAERPQLDRGPRRAPLIVCGLPRTGTTFLHRLLAALPDLRGLPLWQLVEPVAPRGPRPSARPRSTAHRHAALGVW